MTARHRRRSCSGVFWTASAWCMTCRRYEALLLVGMLLGACCWVLLLGRRRRVCIE